MKVICPLKVDRSVTGLVAQQQCVGPLHTPLADVAVVALSHFDTVFTDYFAFLKQSFAVITVSREQNVFTGACFLLLRIFCLIYYISLIYRVGQIK